MKGGLRAWASLKPASLPPLQIFLTKLQWEPENTKESPIRLCSDGWTCCLWPSEGAASPRREAWLCLGGNLHLVDWGTKPHRGENSTTPWAGAGAEHKGWTSAFSCLLHVQCYCPPQVLLTDMLSPQCSSNWATAQDRNLLFLKESCGWVGRVLAYQAWNPGLVTHQIIQAWWYMFVTSTQEGRQGDWKFTSHLPSATEPELHTRLWPVKRVGECLRHKNSLKCIGLLTQ